MIMSNLKLVVFPNPNREDLGKVFRDWDPWGPFFFIVFLGLTLSWSASGKKAKASLDSELLLAFDLTQRTDSPVVFAMAFATCSWSSDPHTKFIASHFVIPILDFLSFPFQFKLGELEAELFVIKAINDNLWRPYNELVEFRGHIESGRDPENYLKYSVQDIERIVKLGELEAELFVIKAINDNLGHIESGRDPENYLKYSVQDIERIVLDFFEEYTHVTPAKLEKTMKEEDWRGYFLSFVLFWFPSHVGKKDSVVQINGVGDMSLKSLLKNGFMFGHDFLQVVAAVHIGWILLFVFICGIKFLNFQKKVKEKRTFVP
ncbi:hypothetical protein DY000_02017330 [Brassica cretica]|uniref:DUF4220 domain-containing protein n=1 Tax=Brassica cretica TaxID=69181 RepID=A0ABQ7CQ08_BRACR|nr:hypothetical protein DY000_02017330 [Brassica cretica]